MLGRWTAPSGAVFSAFAPDQPNTIFSPAATGSRTLALNRHSLIAGLLVFLGYYFGSKIGFALTFEHPVSVLWPPNSILLAALLLTPVRVWWFLLLAAFPAHCITQVQSHVPPVMILCYFLSNSCEALIGAGSIRYFIRAPMRFDKLRNVAIFILLGGLVAPFLSSFIDAGFVTLNRWGQGPYWEIWRIRLFSNVLTALVVAPAIVTWFTRSDLRQRDRRWHYLETCLLFGGLIGVCVATLYNEGPATDPILFYTPLPFLLWATIRLRSRGTATALLAIAFLTIWSSAHGHGPFSGKSPEENARAIQMFLIALTIPFLLLAAMAEERGKAEEWFSKAFRSSPDAMWITRSSDGMLLDANEQWEKIFGHAREQAIGRTILDLDLWNSLDDLDQVLARTTEGNPVRNFEVLLRRNNGDMLPVLLSADLVEMSGESCLILVGRDMTDRKAAEDATRELANASRLAAVGELTASLAHELNQPLSAIVSNANAGMRFIDKGQGDAETVRDILVDVEADAHRAYSVIRNVRSTIQKGEAIREQISLNELVADVTHMLRPDALTHSCDVQTSLARTLPAVQADPVQIQQVLINLVNNAFDAMDETPLSQRRVEISTTKNGDGTVCLSVRDHGSGIPDHAMDRLFERFFTTKGDGLGMGLSIVHSIIEAHGGKTRAENVSGGGARVWFVLPAVEQGRS